MIRWVILALALILAFNVREGLDLPGAKPEPEPSKDPEPFPSNSDTCDVYEQKLTDNAPNQDVYYCRGFKGQMCGSIDPTKPSTPCPVGYAYTSSLQRKRLAENDPAAE